MEPAAPFVPSVSASTRAWASRAQAQAQTQAQAQDPFGNSRPSQSVFQTYLGTSTTPALPSPAQNPTQVQGTGTESDGQGIASESENEVKGGKGAAAFLLKLPPELHMHLLRFLPLSACLIYAQVCSSVRSALGDRFGERGELGTSASARFSLAEWSMAREQLRGLGIVASGGSGGGGGGGAGRARKGGDGQRESDGGNGWMWKSEKKDERERGGEALHPVDGVVEDARLFRLLLGALGVAQRDDVREAGQDDDRGQREENKATRLSARLRLRTLCLIGWHGVSGPMLVHMLRREPGLGDVRNIVKTSRFDDDVAWSNLSTPDAPLLLPAAGRGANPAVAVAPAGSVFVDGGDWDAGHLSLPASVPKTEREALGNHADANADEDEDEDEDAANNSLYKEEDYHSLVRTQAIVRVGTKWRPGETPIKGQGLQVGYECLCFVERNGGGTKPGGQRGGRHQPGSSDMAPVGRPNHPSGSAGADPSRDMDMAGVSRDEQAEGRTDTKTRTRTTRTRVGTHRHLHVIFQGRYREQEALETEMMLERSEIRCNYCKEIIVF